MKLIFTLKNLLHPIFNTTNVELLPVESLKSTSQNSILQRAKFSKPQNFGTFFSKSLLALLLLASPFLVKAQTFDWLNTAPDGNFKQGLSGARWSGGYFDEPPYGIVQFNNNNQTTMTNNVTGTWSQHKFNFGSSATTGRTIGGNNIQFFDNGGTWPFIQNQSTATHTLNFNVLVGTGGTWNGIELIANAGNINFGGTMNNQGKNIYIYGNTSVDGTNRAISLGGVVSGSGFLNVSQFGVVKLNAVNTYTGQTQIDNGELWIQSSGSIASGSSIFVGNGAQLTNVTKFWISNATGGSTVSNAITINNGNTTTRYLGGLNSSGTHTFSGAITNNSTTGGLYLSGLTSGGNTAFSGVISGGGAVITEGAGTVTLSGAAQNTWTSTFTAGAALTVFNKSANTRAIGTGNMTINTGVTVRTDANNQLGTGTPSLITINGNGVFNLNNTNQKIALASASSTASVTLGSGTLNIDNTGTDTYAGVISGTGGVTKTNTGIEILQNTANSYTGTTTITAGEIRLNPSANATFASPIVLDGGTLGTTGITASRTWTSSSTLGLTANSTIALLSATAHTLTFANSNAVSWTGGTTLTITGWSGSYNGTAGTGGRIFIGAAASNLTAQQLSQIRFNNGSLNFTATLLPSGELVPLARINEWSSGASSVAWLTTGNWVATTVAGSTTSTNSDIALFNVNAQTTSSINMNTQGGNHYLGAIQFGTGATTNRTINNNSGTVPGTLNLNAVPLNGIDNTILINQSTGTHLITNGASTMNLRPANTTNNVIQITGTGGITIASVITGSNSITKEGTGSGVLTLSGVNTYGGSTTINNGNITCGVAAALPSTTDVTLSNNSGASLTLGIFSQSINSLAGGGTTGGNVSVTSAGVLTVNGTTSSTYSGVISSTGALVKSGTGVLTLANAANSFTGTTTINSTSEIRLNPVANATYASQIKLNGGKLSTTGIASTRTWTSSSTLSLDANSTIDLGSNAHTITFTNSSGVTWAGSTLTINGWTGTGGASGTAGKIFFGSTTGTLTGGQLAKITFTGYPGTPIILASGELVPAAPLVPSIAIAGVDPGAITVTVGTNNVVLHQYNLAVTVAGTTFSGLTVTTAGTYAAADLVNLKCWYQTTSTFNSGTATLLSTKTTSLGAGTQVFPSFTSQALASAATYYIFITADIASGATAGNNINIDANAFTNFNFSSGTKTGTDPVAAAGIKTFSSLVPSIAITNVAPASSNQNAGTTNVVLQRLDLAVTVTGTTLTGLTVTTAGSYAAADLVNLKCWYQTSATFNAGTATLLSTKTTSLGAGAQVFPSFTSQALASGATYYIFITADIASTATGGNTISLGSTAFSNISFISGTKTGTDPVAASNTVTIVNPAIAISNSSPAASSHIQGSTDIVLNRFDFAVTSSNATLTGITVTTAGTYVSADVLNLKVRYSTDATLDGGDATLSTFTTPGVAGSKTFPSFTSQVITAGTTGYIFITADISSTATPNNTISLGTTAFSNLSFSLGNKSGTPNPVAAGNTRTFIKAEPTNYPTSFACGTTTSSTIPLTWTDASGAGILPDGYLIQWSNTSYASITAPSDGFPVADLANPVLGAINVAQAVGAYTITTAPALSSGTTYFIRIWSYTNSGGNINYKLVSEPQTSCATLAAPIVIVAWDMSTQSNYGTSPLTPSNVIPTGVNAGSLTKGSGMAAGGSAAARAWGGGTSANWAVASATSISNNAFATFTIQPTLGYTISLNAINTFDYRISGSGPTSLLLQYQINSGSFVDIANYTSLSTAATGGSIGSIDLSSITALQNLPSSSSVNFRIVPYGAASGGTWYIYDKSNTTGYDLAVSGFINVAATPIINGSATASSAFTTVYGTVSSAQSFAVSGSNLTGAGILATAPTGFEVSSDGTTYGSTATIAQSGGNASGTVYIRLAANAAVLGTYNAQNIVLSNGTTTANITTTSSSNGVSPLAISINASNQSKTYGSTITTSGSAQFTNSSLANSETISSVTLTSSGAIGTATVAGSPYTITPSAPVGITTSNYTITYNTGSLTVSKATPTVSVTGSATYAFTGSPTGPTTSSVSAAGSGASPTGTATYSYSPGGTQPITVGSYTVTASYPGDGNYNSATSSTFSFTITPSALSDVIENNTTYTSLIPYASYQTTPGVGNAVTGTVGVMKLTVRDGGSTNNGIDGVPTTLTQIKFTVKDVGGIDQSSQLRWAVLATTTNSIFAVATITGSELVFTNASGWSQTQALNGANSADFILRVSYNNTGITDRTKFVYQVSGVSALATGSSCAAANGGGSQSDNLSSNDKNRIDVSAVKLQFVQQPQTTAINVAMSSNPSVEAVDANNIRDLDWSTAILLSSTGTMTGGTISITPTNGVSTYTVTHTIAGTNLYLSATSTGLTTTGNSSTFNITNFSAVQNAFLSITTTGDYAIASTWCKCTQVGGCAGRTPGSGGWGALGANGTPGSSAVAYVQGTVTQSGSTSINDLHILDGGYFESIGSGTFSVSNYLKVYTSGTLYTGKNFTVASSKPFIVEDNADVILDFTFANPSTSIWQGTENFAANSNLWILDWDGANQPLASAANISTNTYNTYNAAFGNVYIDYSSGDLFSQRPSFSVTAANWDGIIGAGTFNLCHKNLSFLSTRGNTNFKLSQNTTSTSGIGGDLILNSGIGSSRAVILASGSSTFNFTIAGNLTMDCAGDFSVCASNGAAGNVTLNVNGNIDLNQSNTTTNTNFILNQNNYSTTLGFIKVKVNLLGNLTTGANSTIVNSGCIDDVQFNFAGTGGTVQTVDIGSIVCPTPTSYRGVPFYVNNGASVKLLNNNIKLNQNSTFTVQNGGMFDFSWSSANVPLLITEAPSPTGTNTFTSAQGSILKITSPDGIVGSGTPNLGNVWLPISNKTFNNTATFWYIGKADQVTGNALTSGSTGKVVICDLDLDTYTLTPSNNIGISNGTLVDALGGKLDIRKGIVVGTNSADFSGSGRLVMSGGTYRIQSNSATVPFLSNYANYSLTGGTVELNATGNQTLSGSPSGYYNIAATGSNTFGTDFKGVSSALVVNNNVLISGTSVFDLQSNGMSGAAGLTMTGGRLRMAKLNVTLPEITGVATPYALSGGIVELYGSSTGQTHSLRGTFNAGASNVSYFNVELNSAAVNIASTQANVVAQAGFSVQNVFNVNPPTCFQLASGFTISDAGVTSTFNVNAGATLKYGGTINASGATGNIRTVVRSFPTTASYGFVGITTPQSVGTGLPATMVNLYMDKGAATNVVTLAGNTAITNQLVLGTGILDAVSNTVSVSNSATTGITGASANSFVSGKLNRSLPASLLTGTTYDFPIGKQSPITYLPASLVNPTTGTGAVSVTMEAFNTNSSGTSDPNSIGSLSTAEYWFLAATGNFNGSQFTLARPTAVSPLSSIARSTTTANGTYVFIGGTPSGSQIANSNFSAGNTQFLAFANPIAPPTITLVQGTSPSFAGQADYTGYVGQTLTITGTGFTSTANMSVSIGGIAATTFTVVNSTTITAVVAQAASGASVVVTNTITSGNASAAFTFLGWISNASTDWGTSSTWLGGVVPPASVSVTIAHAVAANATVANNPNTLTIRTGSSLTFGASGTLTVNTTLTNGGSIIMTAGGILTMANASTFANGTATFTCGTGTVVFAGTATVTTTGGIPFNNVTINAAINLGASSSIAGTLRVNQGASIITNALTYGVTSTLLYNGTSAQTPNALEFPVSNGPVNFTANNPTNVYLPFSRTIPGDFRVLSGDVRNISGTGVTLTLSGSNATLEVTGAITGTNIGAGNDLNLVVSGTLTAVTGSNVTTCLFLNTTVNSGSTLALARNNFEVRFGTLAINGTLRLDANGNVSTGGVTPTYSSTGNLIYNSGTTYGRSIEWSSLSGPTGYPGNVIIQNGTTLNIGSPSTDLGIVSNLTLGVTGSAGSLNMQATPQGITVGGNVTIGSDVGTSTLTLSTNASSPALRVAGNWNRNSFGSFVGTGANGRAVFFNGTGAQSLTANGGETFQFLLIQKTVGSNLTLNNPVTVNSTLTLTSGTVTLGNNDLRATTQASGSSTSYAITNGTGRLRLDVGNTNILFPVGNSTYNPVTLNNSGTQDVYGVIARDGAAGSESDATKIVLRSWDINEGSAGASNLAITAQWNAPIAQTGQEASNFVRGNIIKWLGNFTSGAWSNNVATLSGSNPYTYTASGITTLGIFEPGIENAFLPIPLITSYTPTSAYTGEVITITGTNLNALTSVTLGGTAAILTTPAATSTTAYYIVGNGGASGNLVATNAVGSATASTAFTYLGYITNNNTDWNTGTTWLGGNVPIANATTTVNHDITVNGTVVNSPNTILVNATKSISFGGGSLGVNTSLTNNGTINMTGGGTLTFSANDVLTNNGTFTGGTGEVVFSGIGTVNGTTACQFNNFTINALATLTRVPTINGIFQINTGGTISAAPNYGASSTLRYNIGANYGRDLEWSSASGAGAPVNVQISGNTTLIPAKITNAYNSVVLNVGGNLTIDAGSNMYMDFASGANNMLVNLNVIGNLNLNGNLSASQASGRDIYIGGNWTNNGSGVNFFPNSRAVFLNGTAAQTIGGSNGTLTSFAFLVLNNALGANLSAAINVNNGLTLTNGILSIVNFNLNMGSAFISGASATRFIQTNGTGRLRLDVGNSNILFPVGNSTYNPVTLNNSGTLDVYGVIAKDGPAGSEADNSKIVLRNWDINEGTGGASNLAITAQWIAPSQEASNFVRGNAIKWIGSFTSGAWTNNVATLSGSNPYTYTASGITTLGIFEPGIENAFLQIPIVTSYTPTTAYTGEVITITGLNLNALTSVTLGGSAATLTTPGATSTTAYYIVGNGASGNLVATNFFGSSTASTAFTYLGYITNNNTDWNTGSTWLGGNVPIANATTTVNHDITINGAVTNAPNTILVNATKSIAFGGGSITVNTSVTNNGTINMTGGGTFTFSANDVLTNNGTFTGGTGEVVFSGIGTVNGTTACQFNNFTINALATLTRVPTINGIFQINAGGTISAAPNYGASSTLRYNIGANYGRDLEWSTASGAGAPVNVQISGNTTLIPAKTNNAYNSVLLNVGGNLTIDAGSNMYMDFGSGANNMLVNLNVTGNLNLNGNLSASQASGRDIYVGGNWINNGSGVNFFPNSKAVFLNGTAAQTIGGSNSSLTSFAFLVLNNATGANLSAAININNGLTLTNGILSIGNFNLNLASASITGASTTRFIQTDGTGYLRRVVSNADLTFPVGISTSYAPAILNQAGTSETMGVRVKATPFDQGLVDGNQLVSLQWYINESNAGANNLVTKFQWNNGTPNDEGSAFVRSNGVFQGNWISASTYGIRPTSLSGSDPYLSTSTVNYTGNLTDQLFLVGNINGFTNCIQTANNGQWNDPNSWNFAGNLPSPNSNVCITHNISILTTDPNPDPVTALTLNLGGLLTVGAGKTITIANLGSVVNASGTNLNLGNGEVYCNGTVAIAGANSITFNNLTLNGNTTLTTTPIISNALQLNANSFFVSGSPNYLTGATLIYNTGGSYNMSQEWTGNSLTVGVGIPSNVTIQGGTTVNFPIANRGFGGNLNISNGTLNLNATSGDLYVGGNWTRNNTATFNPNNRAVFFNGNGTQTIEITGGGTASYPYLFVDKTGGSLVISNSTATNVSVTGPLGGNIFRLSNASTFNLNGRTLSFTGASAGNIITATGVNAFTGGAGSLISFSGGTKTITATGGGTYNFGSNVTLALQGTVNFGANLSTINGTLQIANGGLVSTNAPIYATNSTLRYFSGTAYTRDMEWSAGSGAGYPFNVSIDPNGTNTTLNMGSGATNQTIAGNLTINSGAVAPGAGLNMQGMTGFLGVAGNVVINNAGALTLSTAIGGDVKVSGNFTRNTGGSLTQNNREVEMNGNVLQTINGINGFAYLAINNSASTVQITANTTISNRIRLTNGTLDLNSFSITMSNGSEIYRTTSTATMNAQPTLTAGDVYDVRYAGTLTTGNEFSSNNTFVRDLIIESGASPTMGASRTVNRNVRLAGDLNLGTFTLTHRGRNATLGAAGSIEITTGARTITGSTGSIYDIVGIGANNPVEYTKQVTNPASGSLSFGANVIVRIGDGRMDFGTGNPTTINGVLQVALGGSVSPNACRYGVGSTLRFSNTVDYQVPSTDITWSPGAIASGLPGIPWNVEVSDAGTDLQLQDTRALRNNLAITDGTFTLTPTFTGSFNIGGNWTRTNVLANSAFTHNNKKIVFDKQTAGNQTITAGGTIANPLTTETFYDLEVSTLTGDVQLGTSSNVNIANNLNFVNGRFNLNGANTLVIGNGTANGTITGFGAGRYVISNGGNLRRYTNTNALYDFPIGDNTIYSPAQLNLTSGGQANAYIDGKVVNAMHPNMTTPAPTRYIARYWSVEPSGLGATPIYDINYTYSAADEFGLGTMYPVKYSTATTAPGWQSCPGSSANAITGTAGANDNVLKTFSWSGLTTFSDFSGAGNGSPLPVELLSFDAVTVNNSEVLVSWITASEINNDKFIVERSLDAINFEIVGTVKGANNSTSTRSYNLTDVKPYNGVSYYRLRQLDFNGEQETFTPVAVYLTGAVGSSMNVFPNPANENATLSIHGQYKGKAVLQIIDIKGRNISKQQINLTEGSNSIQLEVNGLANGKYLIHVTLSDGTRMNMPLIIAK
jgi:hypothetical protein